MNIYTQAKIIKLFLLLVMLVQVIFFVLAWTNVPLVLGGVVMRFTPNHITFDDVEQLPLLLQGLGAAIAFPEILLLGASFWYLYQFLSQVKMNSLFSISNIRLLRNFAACLFMSIVWSIAEPIVRGYAFQCFSTETSIHYAMGISSSELSLMLMVGLFFLITNIMHEGRKLEEENEAFI